MSVASNPWQGKRVLITGVCGSIGGELLRQLLNYSPAEIVGIDHNETEMFFCSEKYKGHSNVHLYLCDLRDRDHVARHMTGIDIVLHAAAYKHVELCERSPNSAISTNILGTQNVIEAALSCGVERVLFTSSDKAVNPTNVMGTSKLMGERLMTAANSQRRNSMPIFASTRFGNVLGSRGSVIPVFRRQIMQGGPVTITDPGMTRFIMSLEDAVRLVMQSVFLAEGGEVFVTKMPVIRITDLAQVMIDGLAPRHGLDASKIEISYIGSKPGEKLYEELTNEEETRRTFDIGPYLVVMPALSGKTTAPQYLDNESIKPIDRPYNSSVQKELTADELRVFLETNNLLDAE